MINLIKKISLLQIVLFFCACSSLHLYADTHLLNILNATKSKIEIYFDWVGCGPIIGRGHHDKVKIGSGVKYSFHKGCISNDEYIDFSLASPHESEMDIGLNRKTMKIFAHNNKFDWLDGLKGDNSLTLVLRYDRNHTYHGPEQDGYYWSLS
ncbi:MAG: hypothetical protein OXC48_09105 [Endozoicomonadaceae bacterium]|nr:hypothetical protein [Endozoicomonadaceae bacterium]